MEKIPVYLGRKDETVLYLEKSNRHLIIGCIPSARDALMLRIQSGPWPFTLPEPVNGGFPNAVCVEMADCSTTALIQAKQMLAAWPGVRFVARALLDTSSRTPPYYSGVIFVKFKTVHSVVSGESVLREAGLQDIQAETFSANSFTARVTGTPKDIFDISLKLMENPEVEYATPELNWPAARMQKNDATDSMPAKALDLREEWSDMGTQNIIDRRQWHLGKTEYAPGVVIDSSANVRDAHRITTGHGVTIAVIDNGFDTSHPELKGNGSKIIAPQAFYGAGQNSDVRPATPKNSHGTEVAGVACGAGVHGACGVAPDAKLMPLKWLFDSGLASARALAWAADNGADVVVCSWGRPKGYALNAGDPAHYRPLPPQASYMREAVLYATTKGRRGLGCAIFFAAGNSNSLLDENALDGQDNVFSIGACNEFGERSQYSDFGDRLLAVFPSNDYPPTFPDRDLGRPLRTQGIWAPTVLRSEFPGAAQRHNIGRAPVTLGIRNGITAAYTPDFGGTSSAAPGAAGVAALVLSILPDLSLANLRQLIASACDRIDIEGRTTDGVTYGANGHSPYYGYGRINALRAVELAQTWSGLR